MNSISSWTKAAASTFGNQTYPELFSKQVQQFNFVVRLTVDSLWVEITWAKRGRLAFRGAADGHVGKGS